MRKHQIAASKQDFPVANVRHYLEPGPIVLVSSQYRHQRNIMTLGWLTVMEFSPSLVGCMIAGSNHSFGLVRESRECVINLPTVALVDTVVGIGNCSGREVDKFAQFGLTPQKASQVQAPLIRECHVNLECRLYDDALVERYNFFIFEVIKAHAGPPPQAPQTLHYQGKGQFMLSGPSIDRSPLFQPWMLD